MPIENYSLGIIPIPLDKPADGNPQQDLSEDPLSLLKEMLDKWVEQLQAIIEE